MDSMETPKPFSHTLVLNQICSNFCSGLKSNNLGTEFQVDLYERLSCIFKPTIQTVHILLAQVFCHQSPKPRIHSCQLSCLYLLIMSLPAASSKSVLNLPSLPASTIPFYSKLPPPPVLMLMIVYQLPFPPPSREPTSCSQHTSWGEPSGPSTRSLMLRLKTVKWLSASLRIKFRFLPRSMSPYLTWPLSASLSPSFPVLPSHETPSAPVSGFFLKHIKLI